MTFMLRTMYSIFFFQFAPMVFMGGIVKLIVVTAKIMCVIKCLDNALTDARINGRETNVTVSVKYLNNILRALYIFWLYKE